MYWIYRSANSSPFLMYEREKSASVCFFYCKPSTDGKVEKKEGERKEEIKKRKKNRGRKSEKSDGDRWANRQVRKVRREQ